jgi:hypothetical protein
VIRVIGRRSGAWQGGRVSPSTPRPLALGLVLAAGMAFVSCGSLDTPARPSPTAEPVAAPPPTADPNPNPTPAPVFGAPAPKPTPTPEAGEQPSPDPTPTPSTGSGEGGTACGSPLPPPVTRMQASVHLRGAERWVLDSTPLVGPDVEYCRTIGFTDSRSFCPVRPEGNPQRSACELYAIGRAKDTNRPGPTWYRNGRFCTGPASGCENNGDNQFLLNVYAGGTYEACASNGVCGQVEADR